MNLQRRRPLTRGHRPPIRIGYDLPPTRSPPSHIPSHRILAPKLGTKAPRPPSLLRCQHGCPLILVLLLRQQFPFSALRIRWLNPLPRHDTRQDDPDRGSSIHPTRRRPPGQLLAQEAREVVAIVRQKVVARARERARGFLNDCVDFIRRAEGETLEEGAAKRAAGRLETGLGAVDTGEIWITVTAESEFAVE